MNINTIALSTLATVLLAGCGGGGSSGGSPTPSTPTPTPTPVVSKLAAYTGNWVAPCDSHELASMVISDTPGVADSVDIEVKSDYYMNKDCTGAVVGSEKLSAKFTAAYSGSADTATVLTPGSQSVPLKLDLLTLRAPRRTMSIDGPGVVHTVKNGQAQWCMNFAKGESSCVQDEGILEAQGPLNGAFYANGGKLYLLSPSGSVYSTDEIYTRR
ncbi:hypothetical protein PO883_31180 [Massilia sp. DJPM01]|uniref:hypothetical protein n=1 Tax=Massilia sp. DJPM01 TaxID=3024404 RepID=UPI00259D4A40|nr:hypothetical protein [Massilia sp. DJPM01]MDM5181644.1 hypothetical protein [Massilia sp. DJPM01]